LAVVALAAGWLTPAAPAQVATLSLQSQPGDYIGQGQNLTITYTVSEISAGVRRFANGDPAGVAFTVGQVIPDPNTYSTLNFGTDALGTLFQSGVYGLPGNTAQRAPFAQPGHAGLDVTFQNRGSNNLNGNFTINNLSLYTDQSGILQIGSFAASFEQHSEGAAPALFGQFSYTGVPEPSVLAMVGLAAAGFGLCRRSKGPAATRRGDKGDI
jgi:hypothetical protein